MKTPIERMISIAAVTTLLAGFNWSNAVAQIATNPVIVCHPQTQVIKKNKKAKFKVRARNPSPPLVRQTLMYQWQIRGPGLTNFVDIFGETNATFTIAHVTTNDVAYYRVNVTGSYYTNVTTISEPAQLLVYTKNSPLMVYGSPVVSSGSSPDGCPGGYVGYVTYDKGSAWGWEGYHFLNTRHRAVDDNNLTGTKVEAYGYEDDLLCDTTLLILPHPGPPPGAGEDSKYQFTIYFPGGFSVPTVPYPITLRGFKQ